MKTLLIALGILVTTQSFAAKCVISGFVKEASGCHHLSTRLDVSDVETCEAQTKATEHNRFFNILEKDEELLSVKFKFKDRLNGVKVKREFKLSQESRLEACLR